VIHLYAFVRDLDELPVVAGVGGAALETVEVGAATAVVSADAGRTAHDDPLRHGLVVEALAERARSVLPARYGERFPDPRSLVEAAERLVPDVATRLDRLEGRVEIGVRVVGNSVGADVPPADGAGYMRARLRELNERDALVRELHADLEREAYDSAVAPAAAPRLLHDGAYLVGRDTVEGFRERVERYASAHPELTLVCTGPWAPYSFAETAA
jgi:hypothetical protein